MQKLDQYERLLDNSFQKIKADKNTLYYFLKRLPKGGDIGREVIEMICPHDIFELALNNNYFIDTETFKIHLNIVEKKDTIKELKFVLKTKKLSKSEIINSWTLKSFFTRDKKKLIIERFYTLYVKYHVYLISQMCHRLSKQGVQYVECVMIIPDLLPSINNISTTIINNFINGQIEINNLEDLHEIFLSNKRTLDNILEQVNDTYHKIRKYGLKLKFVFAGYRGTKSHVEIFGQLFTAFYIAEFSNCTAGVILTGECSKGNAYNNYLLHLKILDYLNRIFPKVKIAINNKGLENKINQKELIEIGLQITNAKRIMCSSSILFENDLEKDILSILLEKKCTIELDILTKNRYQNTAIITKFFHLFKQSNFPILLLNNFSNKRTSIIDNYLKLLKSYPDIEYLSFKKLAYKTITYCFLSQKEKYELIKELDDYFLVFEKDIFNLDKLV